MTTGPILSKYEIEKIKAEEIFRQQIRNELEPPKKEKNKVLEFLNSAVGIWLLSTVAIGLITWSYSQWTEYRKASNQRGELISKIDMEMANRIVDFENNLKNGDTYITYSSGVHSFLKSGYSGKQVGSQTILNEYAEVSTRALLIQLYQILKGGEKEEIRQVLGKLNHISGTIKYREITTSDASEKSLTPEIEFEKAEIIKTFEGMKIARWKIAGDYE